MDSSASRKYEIRKRDPNPQKAALFVIDMQNYFSSMAKPILHNALTTIDLCRRASIPVIFTRHIHKSPTDLGGMLDEWWNGDLVLDGTTESEIIPEIDRQVKKPDETTAREAFVKGYRVFFSTDATATVNQELHEATLMNLAYGFAYLVDCDRLRQGLIRN